MKYGLTFLLLGAVLVAQAILRQGAHWWLLWPAVSFIVVGLGYVWLGPVVFAKRSDGTLPWLVVIVLLPYLVLTLLVWHAVRFISREDCWNEACRGIFVGRRALPAELPGGVSLVVDLTAEFNEPRQVRQGRDYVCFPVLDATVASEEDAVQTVGRILGSPGPVYIHCAQGHGRTGMIAAAVLVAKGCASNADEAVVRLRAVRPRLTMTTAQLEFSRRVCDRFRTNA